MFDNQSYGDLFKWTKVIPDLMMREIFNVTLSSAKRNLEPLRVPEEIFDAFIEVTLDPLPENL
ncbi:MAG: hypothetical protein CM15mL3_0030 [Kanaloavirus sp.]|nr:MAG: hypothetical protein CM15mL3_0030 [Kanaloavirus sp.]